MPCFALTSPKAGSDAAATTSQGVVCRGTWQGREVVGIRLSSRKRYITLAPVATLDRAGLPAERSGRAVAAGRAHRRGPGQRLGITCALTPPTCPASRSVGGTIRSATPSRTADQGHDVFIPVDAIIGGAAYAATAGGADEWLAAGRSVSLPALSVAGVEFAARATSAYALVRKQFDLPIGRFEGIEEPLARIGGMAYLMNAARVLTCGAVDAGERPAVVSAIVKAYLTEGMRAALIDAMDVRAGAGICRGPRKCGPRLHLGADRNHRRRGEHADAQLIISGRGDPLPSLRAEGDAGQRRPRTSWPSIAHSRAHRTRLAQHCGAAIQGLAGGSLTGAGPLSPVVRRGGAAWGAPARRSRWLRTSRWRRWAGSSNGARSGAAFWPTRWPGCTSGPPPPSGSSMTGSSPGPAFLRWSLDQALWRVDESLSGRREFSQPPRRVTLRLLTFPFCGSSAGRPAIAGRRDFTGRCWKIRRPATDRRQRQPRALPIPGISRWRPSPGAAGACRRAPTAPRRASARAGYPAIQSANLDRAIAAGLITADEQRLLAEAERLREDAIQVDAFDDLRHPDAARVAPDGVTAAARPKLSA